MRLAILGLVALSSTAHASPEFAVGVNSPVGIISGFAYAVSGYVALGERNALRVNIASYASDYMWEDEVDGDVSGRKRDLSVSYVYYPRRVWDGLLIDLGVLGRMHHTTSYNHDFETANYVVDTNVIAARALIGWSWFFGDHVFIAIAGGGSVGYEFGALVSWKGTERSIGERYKFPEWYLRFGGVF